jgi:glutamate-1-semialdehyde 2,1-aminomutase
MLDAALSNSRIVAAYRERTPNSERLAAEAQEVFPSGITHDARHLEPYSIYINRGAGPHKWDVDGNRYVDYFGGHGALLLGHNPPEMVAAVEEALPLGTHFGAGHPLEVQWGQRVKKMIPCAERVRFTASGTESTHMALRLARAFTGRTKVLRFRAHFHGWHDHMTSGHHSHFDGSPTVGVLAGIAESVVLVDPGDEDGVRAALESDRDIAAIIIEPTGASFGRVPLKPEFLSFLREITDKHGVVLIFDEVISGFRVSPGGAQGQFGVTPDLTTLAKIVAGGLPGGAVVGRKDILDMLDFQAAEAAGREKIEHPGTFNGNPVSAAAGIAVLDVIAGTDACQRANDYAAALRAEMNQAIAEEGVPWAVYGTFSVFQIFTNPEGREVSPDSFDPYEVPYQELARTRPEIMQKLRLAMLVNGVDLALWPGGLTSATHGDQERADTIEAFRESLRMLKREGEL